MRVYAIGCDPVGGLEHFGILNDQGGLIDDIGLGLGKVFGQGGLAYVLAVLRDH